MPGCIVSHVDEGVGRLWRPTLHYRLQVDIPGKHRISRDLHPQLNLDEQATVIGHVAPNAVTRQEPLAVLETSRLMVTKVLVGPGLRRMEPHIGSKHRLGRRRDLEVPHHHDLTVVVVRTELERKFPLPEDLVVELLVLQDRE